MKSICRCGKCSVTIRSQKHSTINCHCGTCRGLSGTAFTTWVTINSTEVDLPTAAGKLIQYQTGQYGATYFCPACGTTVYALDNRHPNIVAFLAGTLKDFDVTAPTSDYFFSHKADWYSPDLASKKFGGDDGFTELA